VKGDTRASKSPRVEVFIRSSGGCKAEMGSGGGLGRHDVPLETRRRILIRGMSGICAISILSNDPPSIGQIRNNIAQ
jgi:hypothetical protein